MPVARAQTLLMNSYAVGRVEVRDTLAITNLTGPQCLLMGNQDATGANNPAILRSTNGDFTFGRGNSWLGQGGTFTPNVTFLNNGNVGIGTTSPSQPLTVQGNSLFSGNIKITGNGNGSGNLPTDQTFVIGTGAGHSFNFLNNDEAQVNGIIGTWNTGYNVQDAKIQFNGEGGHSTNIAFYTGNTSTVPNEVMRITAGSSVGIGTTAPTAKLDVAGNTRVGGDLTVTNNATIATQTSTRQPRCCNQCYCGRHARSNEPRDRRRERHSYRTNNDRHPRRHQQCHRRRNFGR